MMGRISADGPGQPSRINDIQELFAVRLIINIP